MYRYALAIDLHRTRIIAFLGAVCAVSLFCYSVFLLLAIEHTASRAKSEAQIQEISTELASLENQYLSATESLTPERAAAMGFVAPMQKSLVYADASGLSLRTNR